jgi:hypothetical protein
MADSSILRDDDRRLNLEQQKTRAKELRRAIAQAEPEAIRRLVALQVLSRVSSIRSQPPYCHDSMAEAL